MVSHDKTGTRKRSLDASSWSAADNESDAAAWLRVALFVSGSLSGALAAMWLGVSIQDGAVGLGLHAAFLVGLAMAVGTTWLIHQARSTHLEESADLEFLADSAAARLVAAESATLVYREILQEAGIGWYRLDPSGHLTAATQATADLLGYDSVDQMRDAHTDRIFPASEHRAAVLNALRAVGEVRGHAASWPSASGQLVSVRDSARTIRDNEGSILFIEGFVSSGTQNNDAAETIRRLELELTQATETGHAPADKGSSSGFVAHMSHELRTPLNAIIGATSLLDSKHLNREQNETIETIRLASESLLSVVNNTLDFARLESGELELESAPVDARTCIEDAIDLVAHNAADHGVETAYRIASGIPEWFEGDAHRLRQILVNLLANAVRFTRSGEISVRMEAEPNADGTYEFTFSVKDTGSGIPSESLKHLFEPYYQGGNGTARRFGGTGLGLSICRMLAEGMGGRIWVESTLGEGSTFTFTIVGRPVPTRESVNARPLKGLRVLLVDDSSSSRATITSVLESLEMYVHATNRPDLAEELLLGDTTFDVVLVQLSGIGSAAFVSHFRKMKGAARLPIVMSSASGTASDTPVAPRTYRVSRPVRRNRLVEVLLHAIEPGTSSIVRHEESPGPERQTLSVLVAEDDVVNGKVISRMIERDGHHVVLVDRGDRVPELVAAGDFDVVLLDVRMPGMTGPEAARAVTAQGRGRLPRMIGMTASTDPAEQEQCIDAGMNVCLIKPISPQMLRDQIAAADDGHDERSTGIEGAITRVKARGVKRRPVEETEQVRAADTEPIQRGVRDRAFRIPTAPSRASENRPESFAARATEPSTRSGTAISSIRRALAEIHGDDHAATMQTIRQFVDSGRLLIKSLIDQMEKDAYDEVAHTSGRIRDLGQRLDIARLSTLCKALEATARGNPRRGAVEPLVRALSDAFFQIVSILEEESREMDAG